MVKWKSYPEESTVSLSSSLATDPVGSSVEFESRSSMRNGAHDGAPQMFTVEESPEDKLIKFDELCKEFLRYYKEFEEFLEKNAPNRTSSDDKYLNYVTFGITGAGKTTTIARLSCDLAPKEFFALIEDRSGMHEEECTINGLTIGHTAVSTTVIPKRYKIGQMYVCDMPGFAETNPQKKISIDVLQKSFLTRVQTSTFLVVVDINVITENKCQTLMQHYHKALASLLGEQYESSIGHLYFVLTKNDQAKYTKVQVKSILSQVIMEILDENPLGARFLRRMSKYNVIVNLEEDDNLSLLQRIDDMVQEDREQKTNRSQIISWRIEKLEAGQNTLNRLSMKNLAELAGRQANLKSQLSRLEADVTEMKEELSFQTGEQSDRRDVADSELRVISTELDEVTKDLDLYEPRKEQIEDSIKDTREMLDIHRRQSGLFVKHFVDKEFINFRCDTSKYVKQAFGKKEGYKAAIRADVNSDGSKERLILVMAYEEDDETLKSKIGRGGSLIPHSLEQIRDIDLASVLYNSYTHTNRCGAELVQEQNGALSLTVFRGKPFKVYIFSARPFKELVFFDDFKKHFDEDIVRDEQKIESLLQQLKRLEEKKRLNAARERELKEELALAKNKVDNCIEETKSILRSHRDACKKKIEKVQKYDSEVQALLKDSRIEYIMNIERIFRKNRIETGLSAPLGKFNSGFDPIKRGVSDLIEAIERFETADDEVLTALLTGKLGV